VPYRLFLVQKNKKCSDKSAYLRPWKCPWVRAEKTFLGCGKSSRIRSTIWKKVRTNEIGKVSAKVVMDAFEDDFNKYSWVEVDFDAIQLSKDLLMRYGQKGLRTLDSIQLSSAVALKNNKNCQFVTFDLRLKGFFRDEGLSVFE